MHEKINDSYANYGHLAIILMGSGGEGQLDRNKLTDEQASKLLKIKEFIASQFSETEISSIRIEAETCVCYDDEHRNDDYNWDNDDPEKHCSCYFAKKLQSPSDFYEYCSCCMPLSD